MTNFRKAPRLYHRGEKAGNFYKLPQNVMDVVLNELSGKQGNEIKLMMLLLGTAGNGSFGVSEEWVRQRTGMAKQNYHRAKKALESKGFLVLDEGKIIVDIDGILGKALSVECDSPKHIESSHHEEVRYHQDELENQHDDLSGNHYDDYNIKGIYNNNIKDNIKDNMSVSSNEEDFVCLFKKIGITYNKNTKRTLEEIIGEELNYDVLVELFDNEKETWIKQRNENKPERYIFGTLKTIMKNKYDTVKRNLYVRECRINEMNRETEEYFDLYDNTAPRPHDIAAEHKKEEKRQRAKIMEEICEDLFVDIESTEATGESLVLKMLDEMNAEADEFKAWN